MLEILVINHLSIFVYNCHSDNLVLVIDLLKDHSHDSTHWLFRDDRVDIIFTLPCSSIVRLIIAIIALMFAREWSSHQKLSVRFLAFFNNIVFGV